MRNYYVTTPIYYVTARPPLHGMALELAHRISKGREGSRRTRCRDNCFICSRVHRDLRVHRVKRYSRTSSAVEAAAWSGGRHCPRRRAGSAAHRRHSRVTCAAAGCASHLGAHRAHWPCTRAAAAVSSAVGWLSGRSERHRRRATLSAASLTVAAHADLQAQAGVSAG